MPAPGRFGAAGAFVWTATFYRARRQDDRSLAS